MKLFIGLQWTSTNKIKSPNHITRAERIDCTATPKVTTVILISLPSFTVVTGASCRCSLRMQSLQFQPTSSAPSTKPGCADCCQFCTRIGGLPVTITENRESILRLLHKQLAHISPVACCNSSKIVNPALFYYSLLFFQLISPSVSFCIRLVMWDPGGLRPAAETTTFSCVQVAPLYRLHCHIATIFLKKNSAVEPHLRVRFALQ